MKSDYLFAIDSNANEIIISISPKGSNKIQAIERLSQLENELLFNAVDMLTKISKLQPFDHELHGSIDKVCQILYRARLKV